MRSRTRPPHPGTASADAVAPPVRRAASRVGATVRTIVDWLRAGYPDEAPTHGYSPLMALYGPIALSQRQTDQVLDELGVAPADPLAIDVAITRATGRLPTPLQIAKIVRTLDERK